MGLGAAPAGRWEAGEIDGGAHGPNRSPAMHVQGVGAGGGLGLRPVAGIEVLAREPQRGDVT